MKFEKSMLYSSLFFTFHKVYLDFRTYFAALELLWSISWSIAAGWSFLVVAENKLRGTLKLWDTFCLCIDVDLIEGISWLGLQLVELEPDSHPDICLGTFDDNSVVDKQRWDAKGGAEIKLSWWNSTFKSWNLQKVFDN